MAQESPVSQIPEESTGWSVPKIILGIAALCGSFLLGFYCGLPKSGGGLTGLTSTRGLRPHAPAESDNSLPVAPPFETNSAPGDLLARAKLENELLYTDLQSFICSEQMDRYQGHITGDSPHRVDTVNTKVSFENGVENYTDIFQNSRQRASLSSIPGAWSEGEFGTLLRQTRALLSTQPVSLQTGTDLNGVAAALYSMDVTGQDSPWDLVVESKEYKIPFRTKVWVSKSSGQIMKIARTSMAIPPDSGISEIEWGVTLKPVVLEGKTWLLPNTGEYSVLYQRANHREWNVINFSDYHRYASRSVIHF